MLKVDVVKYVFQENSLNAPWWLYKKRIQAVLKNFDWFFFFFFAKFKEGNLIRKLVTD